MWHYPVNNTRMNSLVPLDGEPVDENDYPRRDFGPIGPKPKEVKTGDEVKDDGGMKGKSYVWAWSSDYIRPGGRLVSEEVRGTGLVPGLRQVTRSSNGLVISPKRYVAPQPLKTSGVQERASDSQSWTPFQKYGGASTRYRDAVSPDSSFYAPPGNTSVDCGSPGNCSESSFSIVSVASPCLETSGGRTPGRKLNSIIGNKTDMSDFANRYGTLNLPNSVTSRKNRTGKYFKEFC